MKWVHYAGRLQELVGKEVSGFQRRAWAAPAHRARALGHELLVRRCKPRLRRTLRGEQPLSPSHIPDSENSKPLGL